jgi:hypothetical protein
MVGTSAHNIGNCFDRFEKYSDESGFTIYRVGGRDPVNFDIARTTFFKNKIAGALNFTWTVNNQSSYSDSGGVTVTAQSSSPYGEGKTETCYVNTGDFWSKGWNSGHDSRDGEVK